MSRINEKFTLFPLLFIICYPLFVSTIVSCDIFAGKDILDIIDQEVAWANAKKITVTVAYPPEWGNSLQRGEGKCGDARVGYPFNVEFTPNQEYALLGWRAYKTTDLTDDWRNNPARYFDVQKKATQVEGVLFSEVGEGGGIGSVTVKALVDNITLIPFCRAQPRIVYSNPDNNSGYYSCVNPITIGFSAALKADTVQFQPYYITMTCQALDTETGEPTGVITRLDGCLGGTSYYHPPRLADARTIIIEPVLDTAQNILGAPENSEITLTLDRGIETAMGSKWEKPVIIKWRTKGGGIIIDSWEADCEDGQIIVSWDAEGENYAPEISYKVNGGTLQKITNITGNATEWNIPIVPYDPSNLSTIEKYEIWIKLVNSYTYELDEPIQIWNIPGMHTSNTKPIIVINNLQGLKDIHLKDSEQNYILGGNIIISDAIWTPLGTDSANAFCGSLFGMGKTVTLSANLRDFLATSHFKGLFGYLDGAKIQDLTVVYVQPSSTPLPVTYSGSNSWYIGGLAGWVQGKTLISNCIVRGPGLSHNSSTTANVVMGGMVGWMQGQAIIKNSRAEMNVQVTKVGDGNINIGAITGFNSSTVSSSLSGLTATGNVTVTRTSGNGETYAGGINASQLGAGKLENLEYSGTITVNNGNNSKSLFVGGIIGVAHNPSSNFITMDDCHFKTSGSITVTGSTTGNIYVGGIAGGPLSTTQGFYSLLNCTADRDITVTGAGALRVGGIVGSLQGLAASPAFVKGCTYEGASLTVTGSGTQNHYVGGVIGQAANYITVEDCHSCATKVEATKTGNGFLYVGGFCGQFPANCTVKNCDSTSPVKASSESRLHAGGFTGAGVSDINCKFENCSVIIASPGKVEAKVTASLGTNPDLYAGGLIGWMGNGIISGCSAAAEMDTQNNGNRYVYSGGLLGNMDNGSISNSHATGNVTAFSNNVHYSGGLVGNSGAAITESYATGEVNARNSTGILRSGGLVGNATAAISDSYASGGVITLSGERQYAGGLAGYSTAAITGSYATGNVNAQNEGTINSNLFYSFCAGGLVGGTVGNVSRAWAKGNVTATQTTNTTGFINAGGLAGFSEGNTVQNCYATGNVQANFNYDNANTHLAAGGMVGHLYKGATIEKSFATGKVEIASDTKYAARAGGIVGTISENPQSNVRNTAALGESVTASTGPSSAAITALRIGNKGVNNFANNYARNTMRTGTGTSGYAATVTTNTVSGGVAANENGADVSTSEPNGGYNAQSFWEALGFTFTGASPVWKWETDQPKLIGVEATP